MRNVIGLTGGIATGKSSVATILKGKNFKVICADEINHKIQRTKKVIQLVVAEFGKEILDEENMIDRHKLGDIVFNDKEKLIKLQNIIHPLIVEEIKKEVTDFYTEADKDIPLILDVPLLFETEELIDICKSIIVVYSNIDIQVRRLMKRNDLTEEEAGQRINKQMPISEKIKKANIYVNNNYDFTNLEKEVEKVLMHIKN